MVINNRNNFVRIFKIPKTFPSGFYFGGGKPVIFEMVDWFEPYPKFDIMVKTDDDEPPKKSDALVPLLECPNNEIELTSDLREKLNELLCGFIRKKNYSNGSDLLAITNYGDSFIIKP